MRACTTVPRHDASRLREPHACPACGAAAITQQRHCHVCAEGRGVAVRIDGAREPLAPPND